METLILILLAAVVLYIIAGVKKVSQGTVCVVESLGKYNKTAQPGIFFWPPITHKIRNKVLTCEQSLDIPPQDVITKDNVQVKSDSCIFFEVVDPKRFTYGINNWQNAMTALCISALRSFFGQITLDEAQTRRQQITAQVQTALDEATDKWGIKVNRVEIQKFILPHSIQESMSRQKKAEQEKREQVTLAEAAKESAIINAQKNKEVARMNAEAKRDAASLNAEASRIAVVQKAEAERQAEILKAEAAKEVRLREAEAEAEAIRIVEQAKADGIRMINAATPTDGAVQIKALDTFLTAANSPTTQMVIPSDIQKLVGQTLEGKKVKK